VTQRDLRRIVRDLVRVMNLRDWRIRIDFETRPAHAGSVASTWRSTHYDDAVIYLCEGWRGWVPAQARQIMAHELGHLITRDLDRAVESLEDELEGSAWNLYFERYIHELEGVVDRYAEIIAELSS
jgi:hypothetical protein